MKKTKLRLAATLFAVMLSVTAFSMPAFAYSQEPVTDGTPAETSTPETGTASTDATADKDGSSTAALTPKGIFPLWMTWKLRIPAASSLSRSSPRTVITFIW